MIVTWLSALAISTLAARGFATAVDPEAFVKENQSQVTALLRAQPGAQRDAAVGRVLDSMIDYRDLTEQSMQDHWADLSPSQRKEFSSLLKRLVQRSYEKNIHGILDWDVEYLGDQPTPSGILVQTRATPRTNVREEPVTIDYQLKGPAGQWRVTDIIIEGSSMVKNYRGQFDRIIQKEGFDALLERMRTKAEEGGAGGMD